MAVTSTADCADIVRRHDPDRFMLSLLAPSAVRGDLWTLYAFNHEIAKTREVVTETGLGLIRLQWWRDAVAGIYAGRILEQPVIQALADAIKRHDLPQDQFDALIYAREFDLEDRLPASLDGMEKYAEFTTLPLLELTRKIVMPDMTADVRDLAIGYALTGILRATPVHMSQRRCYLPADRVPMIDRHYEGHDLEHLQPVIHAIVSTALQHLATTPRLSYPKIFRGHRKLAFMWLKKIEKAGFNLFDPRLQVPPFMREIRLLVS